MLYFKLNLVQNLPELIFALQFLNCTAKSVQPKIIKMKKGLHPENYKFVVFKDMSNGQAFLGRSTGGSKEKILQVHKGEASQSQIETRDELKE